MGLSLTATRDGTARFGRSMLIPVRSTALVPRWLAGDGHYTRGASRRTRTRSSRTPTPPGAAANAVSSSGLRRRSSWATIGASASTSSANPSSWITRQEPAPRVPVPRRSPRRSRSARQPKLVLQPEGSCRGGHQVADPHHRPAPAGHEATPAPPTRPAPSGSARTSQWSAIARRPWSRSSRVVVVTNAWGRAAIRRTRCERRSGSSSRTRRRAGAAEGAHRGPSGGPARRAWRRGSRCAAGRVTRMPPGRGRRARTRCRHGAARRAWSRSRSPFSVVSTSRRSSASRGVSPGSAGAFVT